MKHFSVKIVLVTMVLAITAVVFLLPHTPVQKKLSPEMNFLFGDFGSINKENLKSHVLPVRLTLAALVVEGRSHKWIASDSLDYLKVLERFGFFTPSKIKNWRSLEPEPHFSIPIGFAEDTIRLMGPVAQLRAMNLSCASCHGGRLYDSLGHPTTEVWMGLPNTSLNLELYTDSIYRGLKKSMKNWNETLEIANNIQAPVHFSEPLIERYLLTRIVNTRLENKTLDRAFPFLNGSPGVTNGVAALKLMLGLIPKDQMNGEYGFTSIPTVGDRNFRSSLLYDGFYAPPGRDRFRVVEEITNEHQEELARVVAVFSLPSMGVTMEQLPNVAADIATTSASLIGFDRKPEFPGPKNEVAARSGLKLFTKSCSSCHGEYSWATTLPNLKSFPNKSVSQDIMNTDPHRWQAISPELLKKLNGTNVSRFAEANGAGGYVAPLLTSIWATAPYLHNGSVPTLWELMNPAQRSSKFLVGGHNLDYKKMGILLTDGANDTKIYPSDVVPFSEPVLYDVTKPGQSNQGHEQPFIGLTDREKRSIIEFLKYL